MEFNQIGKYKILREIGVGGMGVVYQGLDPKTQTHVAVKFLPPSMVDRSTVERFTREAAAMSRMNHPRIVKVFESGMTGGRHYYVMEFIHGDTVKAVLKKVGKIPERDTLAIMAQIADALAYVHREGVIHRDIKPANIMLSTNGQIKLMDFGLVQIPGLTRVTMENSTVGTAEYMSPEQIDGEGVDSRSDLYSLGVTMYEMLAGKPPFQAETAQAVLMKHRDEIPRSLREVAPEVSPGAERVVMKALSKSLAARYQKAEEFLEDIRRLGVGPAATASSTQDSHQSTEEGMVKNLLKPAARKGRNKNTKIMFLAIVLLIAGAVFFLRDRMEMNIIPRIFQRVNSGESPMDDSEQHLRDLELAEQHDNQGRTCVAQGDFEKAILEFKNALELRRDYSPYYQQLAEAYEHQKDFKNAVQVWKDLLKYVSSGPRADLARRRLQELLNKE